jgi:hypothetical protein
VGHLNVGAAQAGSSRAAQRQSLRCNCCIGTVQAGYLDAGAAQADYSRTVQRQNL